MARSTAFLVAQFRSQLSDAQDIAATAEVSPGFVYVKRLFVYEAAYLLAFSAWENLLEQSFVRFLAGYQNTGGVPPLKAGIARPANVADATTLMLGGSDYKLWHNPAGVIKRAQAFMPGGPHDAVLSSASADVTKFAAIRHYVAHRSPDSKSKFLIAARALSGSGVLGARAGRFLRSKTIDPVTTLPCTWFDRISADLERYAKQIAA